MELTYADLAKIEELFTYKSKGFKLEEFPGYSDDQWGIKAHNRPWIEEAGNFAKGQKIIEVGGAYSLLPKYLAEKYDLEAWIGDDFGMTDNEQIWSRWGNPLDLPQKYPMVKYVFEPFGKFSEKYPDAYFDRIFSVSTMEHIPHENLVNVFKDMHRCLKPDGMQLHTIDVQIAHPFSMFLLSFFDKIPILNRKYFSEIKKWKDIIKSSGVNIAVQMPNPMQLLERSTLVESPDVVYRFYPPNDSPKPYNPGASLLLIIKK